MSTAGARNTDYRPPFVWFGGKSAIADKVWAALGDVDNYVEPFFGSGAVLFLRDGIGKVETVNDADGFVANFWRALQRDPCAVADAADWPVNEADLHARHLWLLGQRERITERLMGDAEFFDAKAAGWCSGRGPWIVDDGGSIALRNTGHGVNRSRPHLGDTGRGVNRKLPHLGDTGRGEWLRKYLGEFAARLARVRVCCGDWRRVCGPSVTFKHGLTGVFLDPPYADTAARTGGLYAVDCQKVAHDVREWAIEQGARKDMRIVLAGYEGEHTMPADWRTIEWKASGGYALANEDPEGVGRQNSAKERLWLSPACLDPDRHDAPLFVEDKS